MTFNVSLLCLQATRALSWEKPDVLKTAAEKTAESGDWCWVRDAKEAWVPARQGKKNPDGSLECTTQSGTKVMLDKSDAVWPFSLSSLSRLEDDIVMLDAINEGQIIHNLRERYLKNKIYTWCGANKNVLISVNPFQNLPLYSPEIITEHAHPPPNKSLEPHVFDIAQGSFKSMSIDRLNQCILISGESGAGKTEATKQCLSFLADVAESASNVEDKILRANPVLEAFGNAKTLRNNNSSRFGKW
jgi:myosin heavy subunit